MKCLSARPGWRWLAWAVAAAAAAGLRPAVPVAAQAGGASEATYEVTFQGNWTTASTPGGVVGGAHFTTLIGAAHSGDVTFWRSGERATPGVEVVAETGSVGTFRSEVNASPHTKSVIQAGVRGGGTGSATFTITLDRSHPRVTLLSMIGPSPDWFVGVSGLSLLDSEDTWRQQHSVDLFPYDAGTEEGTEFSLSNPATVPQGVITSIRGQGKFSNVRMARLVFDLQQTDPPPPPAPEVQFASASAELGEASGTHDVTVDLSPAPRSGVTLSYTLSGTATRGTDYSISGVSNDTGTIAVAAAATSATIPVAIVDDDSDEPDETVILTLEGDSGYTLGNRTEHTLTIADDDEPEPVPALPALGMLLLAGMLAAAGFGISRPSRR